MIDFNQNITKELQASAERFFVGFGENTRSVEVKIYEKEHVLSIKIYNKKLDPHKIKKLHGEGGQELLWAAL